LKRLIEQELRPDSPEHALAELVRATPALDDAPSLNQQIFAQLSLAIASSPRPRWSVPVRRAWVWGPAALVFAGAAAAAAVEIGHRQPVAPSHVDVPAVERTESLPPPAVGPESSSPPPIASAPAVAPVEAPSTGLKLRSADRRPAGSGEDPTLVLEAIRALRTQGDASRASALLAEYLRTHPRGVLSEDALALSIESAIARHDSRAAADLGRRYLAKFPNGRYRAFASQAVPE
jgi:hypothetical protein